MWVAKKSQTEPEGVFSGSHCFCLKSDLNCEFSSIINFLPQLPASMLTVLLRERIPACSVHSVPWGSRNSPRSMRSSSPKGYLISWLISPCECKSIKCESLRFLYFYLYKIGWQVVTPQTQRIGPQILYSWKYFCTLAPTFLQNGFMPCVHTMFLQTQINSYIMRGLGQ